MQVLMFETGEMMSLIMEIKRVLIERDLLQPEWRSNLAGDPFLRRWLLLVTITFLGWFSRGISIMPMKKRPCEWYLYC